MVQITKIDLAFTAFILFWVGVGAGLYLGSILQLKTDENRYTLGTSTVWWSCEDTTYRQEAASGKYKHVFCRDAKGDYWRDGRPAGR